MYIIISMIRECPFLFLEELLRAAGSLVLHETRFVSQEFKVSVKKCNNNLLGDICALLFLQIIQSYLNSNHVVQYFIFYFKHCRDYLFMKNGRTCSLF